MVNKSHWMPPGPDGTLPGPLHRQERALQLGGAKRHSALLIERAGRAGLNRRWTPAVRTSAPCCAIWRLCPEGTRRGSAGDHRNLLCRSESEGFWYPAVGLTNGSEGELLGHLEALSGCRLQEVRAEFDGIVLYYIALGVRAGDPLIARSVYVS